MYANSVEMAAIIMCQYNGMNIYRLLAKGPSISEKTAKAKTPLLHVAKGSDAYNQYCASRTVNFTAAI